MDHADWQLLMHMMESGKVSDDEFRAFHRFLADYKKVKEENDRLHERLEDSHVYAVDGNGQWVRKKVPPGSVPDGIECRDETIRGLQAQLDERRCL